MWTCSSVPDNIKIFSQGVQVLHPIKHTNGVLDCPRDFIVANISVRQTRQTEIDEIHSIQLNLFTEILQSEDHIIMAGVPVELS